MTDVERNELERLRSDNTRLRLALNLKEQADDLSERLSSFIADLGRGANREPTDYERLHERNKRRCVLLGLCIQALKTPWSEKACLKLAGDIERELLGDD